MPFNFNEDFLNNPALQYGLNLLGSRGAANPYATAQTAMQKLQEAQQQQLLQQAQTQAQQVLAEQHQEETKAKALKNQLLLYTLRKRGIGNIAGPRNAVPPMPQPPQEDMGPGGQGIPGVPPGYNGQGQSVNPYNEFVTPGVNQIGMRPAAMQFAQEQAPAEQPFERISPEAEIWALAGEPKLAEFYQEANKPIVTRDGGVLLPMPDGSYRIAKGSVEAQQIIERMRESTKAEQDLVTVPVEGHGDIQMTRLQASAYYNTGQLPPQLQQRLGGQPPTQPAQSAQPVAPAAVRGNNYGNMRPPGASKGFQQFATPEEGIAAIDKQLQIYGGRGINTLEKIIGTWAPPSENDTRGLVAAASKRLGIPANKQLNMSDPAVRQLVSSAIMLQEHGSKLFANAAPATAQQPAPQPTAAAPRIGFKTSPQAQAQLTQTAETWGKFNTGAQEASVVAGGKINNINALEAQLNKIPRTGWNTAAELGWNKLIASAGFKPAKYASSIEAAQALSKSLALEMRDPKDGGGSPGQISNFETRLFQQMVASPDKLRESNRIMIQAYKRKQERKIKIAGIYRKYADTHGGIVDQGVMPEIEALLQAEPLFTPEEGRIIDKETLGSTSLGNKSGSGPANAVGERIKGAVPSGVKFLGFE